MIIQIDITNKVASVIGAPVIVCGNSDYKLSFTFDAEWSDQAIKTARFVYVSKGEVKSIEVPFDGPEAPVPKLLDTKEVFIGVYAGDLYTTTPARLPCAQSIRCMGAEPEDPTPSQYDQIIAMLNAGIDSNSVKYVPQTLTDDQKAQARKNIDAALAADVPLIFPYVVSYGTDTIEGIIGDTDTLKTSAFTRTPVAGDAFFFIATTRNGDVCGVEAEVLGLVNGGEWTQFAVKGATLIRSYILPIENGGTGATNADEARKNLGAAPAYTYGTEDIEAGSASTAATGTLHFVYE